MFCRNVASEAIARMTRDILDIASCHDVRIDIDGIDRVSDAHEIVGREDIAYISCIAFGTIADENFFTVELNATRDKIVLDNGIDEEVVTMFWSIASEGLTVGTFIHSSMHGLNCCIGQRTGHVANTETDDVCLRMFGLICIHLLGNLGKEIAVRELQIVCVDVNHIVPF